MLKKDSAASLFVEKSISAETMTKTTVNTVLNFWLEPSKGGFDRATRDTEGHDDLKFNPQPVQIADARGAEDQFTLDKNGFQFVHAPTNFKRFNNDDAIQSDYFKEIEALLKTVYVQVYREPLIRC